MVLIIGGAFQGKTFFALNTLGFKSDRVFDNLECAVKNCIDNDGDTDELIKKILSGGYDAVICREIGCGIVPVDKNDRSLRERTGRVLCTLAENCTQLWRVQCGIGIKIKG